MLLPKNQEVLYAEKTNYHRQTEFIKTDQMLTYGRPDFVLRSASSNYSFKESKEGLMK